jgi:hypothetical protein
MIFQKRRVAFAAASVIIIPALLVTVAYGITTIGPNSICFSEGGWSGKIDKIEGAREFISHYAWKNGDIKYSLLRGINMPSCCSINKGELEIPYLGFSAFILQGEAHYIHVPMFGRFDKKGNQVTSSIIVDGCGKGTSAGVAQ